MMHFLYRRCAPGFYYRYLLLINPFMDTDFSDYGLKEHEHAEAQPSSAYGVRRRGWASAQSHSWVKLPVTSSEVPKRSWRDGNAHKIKEKTEGMKEEE